ncbi:hypothetical protein HCN44_003753 [Aphidius gifuensis]|uniref:5'-3' exoribonuclease 1 n=1 Tax=Aphidius gifuensis TaxID=684658 RepID=A0A835CPA1_APHGI|nr:5'-3' exoribonuclease 1 [Aphidius gifuensis]KAF7987890.1 hypothetical protein HCN44_003753 [Aphidius gifuensis]
MGIPKFTRFICERYPCILEILNEYQIPDFDNLYLDMNGIVHNCSHPNDADAHFRITEETIFKNIFLYVEVLFRTIKPQKLFFMAVDGVAPRAKINQQRSRRFRSAKDAELAEAKARAAGEVIPEGNRFDSNCITPGTEFMSKLTEQLKYFVTYKISTDSQWKKCKIILSGPEVPGEGEHKIMDYIRYLKSQPDYDINTRHCLYGLDADLIMLSLCTHEPHFAVLREEVTYGKQEQKKIPVPEKIRFCLLHISLLREYMDHEFSPMKDKLSFKYDIEKIIDDWILLGFLVGNDFIPPLPNLHIANGALPILYQTYMEILPTLDGYINEAGKLNLSRFEKFMAKLAIMNVEHYPDLDDLPPNYKYPKKMKELIQMTEEILLEPFDDFVGVDSDDDVNSHLVTLQKPSSERINAIDEARQYADKRKQVESYISAIQWNLHYYYDGCCSWSWFYPTHYAPDMSDIKDFKDFNLQFDIGKPFLPFQQLLAVLPSGSRSFLPEAYQHLLTDENSPIIDYYPADFETDLNGKEQEWEAIVLIPFIDEKRLIDAMEPYNSKLTEEEKNRNKHGKFFIITYTDENLGKVNAPEYFPSIDSHAKIILVDPIDIQVPIDKLIKGLCKNIDMSIYYPGFPSLQYVEHTARLEKTKVRVFKHPSRGENMMINVVPKKSPTIEELASELLGKIVLIGWPCLLEALVVGVSNSDRKFSLINQSTSYCLENLKRESLKGPQATQWISESRGIYTNYKTRYGIDIGDIDTLIHAKALNGYRYAITSKGNMSMEKVWKQHAACYAYQVVVRNIQVNNLQLDSDTPITNIYSPNSICFMLGHPHYGAMGEVNKSGINEKTGRVKIAMMTSSEPNFDKLKIQQQETQMQYMHGSIAAQRLGISSHLLSRITGSIFVTPSTTTTEQNDKNDKNERRQKNIGLNLKFNKKNEELPGYTKKVNGQWLYGAKSVGLIRNFMEKYPVFFEKLAKSVGNDVFNEDDLFSDGINELLVDVIKWLKEQPFRNIDSRSCDWQGLDPEIVQQIQIQVDKFNDDNNNCGKTLMMQVKPHLLYKPGLSKGNIPPDTNAKHELFDRIITVNENSSVPIGYKGTIISIQGTPNDINKTYEILFDKPFIGGISFNGDAVNRYAKLDPAEFINISHGIRAEQNISGTSIPDQINFTTNNNKQTKQTSQQQKDSKLNSSAFASFNHNNNISNNKQQCNFFPTFGKDKHTNNHQQKQQQGQSSSNNQQPQIRVMKKNDNLLIDLQTATSPSSSSSSLSSKQRNDQRKSHTSINDIIKTDKIKNMTNVSDIKHEVSPSSDTSKNIEINKNDNKTSEYQMLWNELQKVSNANQQKTMSFNKNHPPIPPATQLPVVQSSLPTTPQSATDQSAFLRAVLKIPSDNINESSTKLQGGPITSMANKPFVFPPTPPAPPPPMVLQMFDHARQANNNNNLRQNEKSSISNAQRLINLCQMRGTGLPKYFYKSEKNLFRVELEFPDKKKFYSELCTNHELAIENAASKALAELSNDNELNRKPHIDIYPPGSWLNIMHQSTHDISSQLFPDTLKLRPQSNWNHMMPPQPPGFAQMPPIRMNQSIPTPPSPSTSTSTLSSLQMPKQQQQGQQHKFGQANDAKQNAPFVPLQAQKKTRNRNNSQNDSQNTSGNNSRDNSYQQKIHNKPNKSKGSPKVNTVVDKNTIKDEEKTAKENDNLSAKDLSTVQPQQQPQQQQQKINKPQKQRRSRIAANFGPSPAPNGDDKQ